MAPLAQLNLESTLCYTKQLTGRLNRTAVKRRRDETTISSGRSQRADMRDAAEQNDEQMQEARAHTASLLLTIQTGALWTASALYKAGYLSTDTCPWCNTGEAETLFHLWWRCPTFQAPRDLYMQRFPGYGPEQLPIATACHGRGVCLRQPHQGSVAGGKSGYEHS